MTPTLVIAVDCRALIDQRISGVSIYTMNMIQALQAKSNVDLHLFYQSGVRAAHLHEKYPEIQWVNYSSFLFHLKCLIKLPKLDDNYFPIAPDLIWLPDRRPFYRTNIPIVMTIHDMVPRHVPKSLSWRSRIWHKLFSTKSLLKRVNGVLVPSFSIEQEIPRNIPRRVTYEGSSLKGNGLIPKNCPKQFSLMIAPQDPRKGIDWFIKLANEFPKDNFVWAGLKKNDPRFAKIKSKLGINITLLGEITDQEKIGLMKQARCLFAISRYEGFDLPALEAINLKCPVILSDISVHRELYKETNFVSNYEELRSEYLRAKQNTLPLAKPRGEYTWEKAAQIALLFFRRVIENKNR